MSNPNRPKRQTKANASSQEFVRKAAPKKRAPARRAPARRAVPRNVGNKARYGQVANYMKVMPQIEPCTAEYLNSLIDPTSEESRGACLPSGFPMPSQKVRSFARGTFACGTTGVGYIYMNAASTNDVVAAIATSSTSVGTNSTVLSSFTNTTSINNVKNPYSAAQVFTNKLVAARLVSQCIRIRYAGVESSRNGIVTTIESPDHEAINSLTPDQINLFEQAERYRPSGEGEWCTVSWSGPVAPVETQYQNATSLALNGAACMGILVQGIASDLYEYEIWQNLEYIGSAAIGKTLSHVDEQGYGKVVQVIKGHAATQSLKPEDKKSIWDKVKTAFTEYAPSVLEVTRNISSVIASRGRGGGMSRQGAYTPMIKNH